MGAEEQSGKRRGESAISAIMSKLMVIRLGLGHPLLEPGADKSAGPSTARRDFAAITKQLGKAGTVNSSSKRSRQAEDDDDDEEETSRFRSVGKGKGKMEAAGVQALLNGKKKKKKAKREEPGGTEKAVGNVAETQEESAPSIAPLAILKPLSGPSPPSSPEPDASSNPASGFSSGKTKAERRREAKKRRKEDKKKAHGQ